MILAWFSKIRMRQFNHDLTAKIMILVSSVTVAAMKVAAMKGHDQVKNFRRGSLKST